MKAFERFLNYVTVHTTSNEESGQHPSFAGEWNLAGILKNELDTLGLHNTTVSDKCYVYGLLPATKGCEKAPTLALIAHMDTSPETSGENVKPVLYKNYDGTDIELEGSHDILSVSKFPVLKNYIGDTLITTDGLTLLGADDKAGVAEIITAIETLVTGNIPHGNIWVAFTPDEEIGEGADFFDLDYVKADYAYTVDGGDVNCIEYENFNAASANVTVKGVSVHPGSAKDVMINASNVAHEFHSMLPESERPEHTENHEGFYHLTDMRGQTSFASLSYIIRDHDRDLFAKKKAFMQDVADKLNAKYGDGTIALEVKDQYYNMLEKIKPHMHLVENAKKAISLAGLTPIEVPVRGGTDGARLSYEGLPCPNLGTGGCNYHGNFECVSIEKMEKAVEIVLNLINIYKDC